MDDLLGALQPSLIQIGAAAGLNLMNGFQATGSSGACQGCRCQVDDGVIGEGHDTEYVAVIELFHDTGGGVFGRVDAGVAEFETADAAWIAGAFLHRARCINDEGEVQG